ncbi:unnamed protein product [Chilo suppressalis]|uniref:Uncharacterized protein n=1 Tax=Chilo suppressalis TaxID=168631 RepID=A0ABN8AY07_CHISP|nr:unnamed protein product [Chilo suppressalis]
MRDIPECLSRRYQVLDELVEDLTLMASTQGTRNQCPKEANDASVKLMCEFWNILKENPDCNLTQAVRERMGLDNKANFSFRPHRMTCFMAEQEEPNTNEGEQKKRTCCVKRVESPKQNENPESKSSGCCSSKSISPRSTNEGLPLSKVLCNLKEAVSFDKKCNARIGELVEAQKQLKEQIQQLEEREKEGTELLKQAECMWSCMEAAYKMKVKESLERQSNLLKQMKEIETSNTKWRKNKKDLENQVVNVDKCCKEIKDKHQEKNNDIKCIRMEIDNFKDRIEKNTKQLAAVKKSFDNKKKASDAKVASLSAEMTKMKKVAEDEKNYKMEKEQEGSKYIKEARDDLQKIYRLLLQKKLENEDLRAEKQTLLQELDLLKKTCEQCKDKCQGKEKTILDELGKVDAEIAGYKARCIQCHQSIDTTDVRKFCVDCPRCVEQRDCLYKDGYCCHDTSIDCVCMNTKEKFMDNVFDNMYSVLEKQIKSPNGKAVANAVLDCLKKSRNGKLNEPTRKKLQEFVLTSVKKNLELTIVGGAVKTRCEMDPDTYNQLMLCLKLVKPSKPPKEDKGTVAKKEPCPRWGETSECNCPKGPKGCICTKKGLPNQSDLESCPTKDKDNAGEVTTCPLKEPAPCSSESGIHKEPSAVGKEVASRKPESCNDKKCAFSKNMRAAQCVLGPDSLITSSKNFKTKVPLIPDISVLEDQIVCKCGSTPMKPCPCKTDTQYLKIGVDQLTEGTIASNSERDEVLIDNYDNESEKLKEIVEKINGQSHSTEKKELQKMVDKSENIAKSTKSDELKSRTLYKKQLSLGKSNKKATRNDKRHLKNQLTNLTKTPSGSVAMEFDKDTIKQIEKQLKRNREIHATIVKTDSGHHMVNFSTCDCSNTDIFVFKKSLSGSLLMEIDKNNVTKDKTIPEEKDSKNSVSVNMPLDNLDQIKTKQSIIGLNNDEGEIPKHNCDQNLTTTTTIHKENKQNTNTKNTITSENNTLILYKLLIKDANQDLDCPLAVLQETKSSNYILNVDMEYEKPFKKTMKEHFGSDFECPIELSRKSPGSIVVDFVDNKDTIVPNAVITRSKSGNITIKANLKIVSNQFNIRKSFSSQGKRASEVFSKIINRLPGLNTECADIRYFKDKKSCSDSNLLHKVKIKVQNQQNLLSESSVLLKRTSSGRYAVVLNKDSKKSFINNLKRYVSSDSHGKVPIKRTENGEIIILLNNETNENNQYDSLKITSSGNIYVIVDENSLKNIPNKIKNKTGRIDKDASAVQIVESKNVTTTCNAVPDSCDSCNSKKCVCGEVLRHGVDDIRFDIDDTKCVKSFKFCSIEDSHYDCKKFKCRYKIPNKYSESFSKTDRQKPRDKSPHIVIRQCSCRPESKNETTSNEQQLFYVSQSVCPFHKDRHETVSNELIEISALCNNPQKMDNEDEDYGNSYKSQPGDHKLYFEQNDSDYLKFLPPQLPPFLCGYRNT